MTDTSEYRFRLGVLDCVLDWLSLSTSTFEFVTVDVGSAAGRYLVLVSR